MALKPCSQCGHTISTLAFACPMCGAPGDAPRPVPATPRPPAAASSPGAGASGSAPDSTPTSKALLVVGALAMALLGAMVDGAIHRRTGNGARTRAATPVGVAGEGTDSAELRRAIASGLQGRSPAAVMDTVRAYQEGARNLRGETELRLALADVTTKQEMWYAEHASYAADLVALRVTARAGVHVSLVAGPNGWSAAATHEKLPGVTCRCGVGNGEARPGQIACEGTDTLHGRLP